MIQIDDRGEVSGFRSTLEKSFPVEEMLDSMLDAEADGLFRA